VGLHKDRAYALRSSTTASKLRKIEETLSTIENRYRRLLEFRSAPSAPTRPTSTSTPHNQHIREDPAAPLPEPEHATSTAIARRTIPRTYFRTRDNEDRQGGEIGLLPLKTLKPSKGDRDALLGGVSGGLGAAQLHEELGGQLVDVSIKHFRR
jgi:hypothetical protein